MEDKGSDAIYERMGEAIKELTQDDLQNLKIINLVKEWRELDRYLSKGGTPPLAWKSYKASKLNVHELKTIPKYFWEILEGNKMAEFRRDDRGFKVGDLLVLREWDKPVYTGKRILLQITHITKDTSIGIPEDYVMMSFRKVIYESW